jgi:hypothetical protein
VWKNNFIIIIISHTGKKINGKNKVRNQTGKKINEKNKVLNQTGKKDK